MTNVSCQVRIAKHATDLLLEQANLLLSTDVADDGAGWRAVRWAQNPQNSFGKDLAHCSKEIKILVISWILFSLSLHHFM